MSCEGDKFEFVIFRRDIVLIVIERYGKIEFNL